MTIRGQLIWQYLTSPKESRDKFTPWKKSMEVPLTKIINQFLTISHIDTGIGDLTYNPKRNLLGGLTNGEKIAYHLYSIGYPGQKSSIEAILLRKSKWNSQYSNQHDN